MSVPGPDEESSELTNQAVDMLLKATRENIESGNMFQALSAVLHAIRLTEGEEKIMDVLKIAKEKIIADMDDDDCNINSSTAK